jgi:hypothetical protein
MTRPATLHLLLGGALGVIGPLAFVGARPLDDRR